MKRLKCAGLGLALLAGAAMGGCELTCSTEPKGPAEKIGESIDKAVNEVKSGVKEAKEDIERPKQP